ncbi:hypothetical protein EW146_g7222 [Bondarzewia mesenterica]|uniref:UDENN domain-containing protein n=1 Tax=Bondarzewia mesenterica TaxID=1095465 RepID=A0A4S4LM43_9AGAM|nr:hypothetical protein EW146_g7222 [Bondarzewia mesenterica]
MSSTNARGDTVRDVVAIFHASFHPTQGNIVDWSLKADEDLDIAHVEFSALPSGLHLVDQDVVYFDKDGHPGVCVFRRRKTTEHGQRGFRLSSLGILLARSRKPRPWLHVPALKALVRTIYDALEERGVLEPLESDWDPARRFFEERKVSGASMMVKELDVWTGWSHELDGPDANLSSSNPILHLSHLLRILGPSCLTLYKHILGRRRVLIYTLPPVEASCILCQVAADICYEDQVDLDSSDGRGTSVDPLKTRLKGKHKEGVNVLGIVTLHDIDKLIREGKSGRGWIACTTDAIFLERPQYYDLIIDLRTSTPAKTTRPTMYSSRPQALSGTRGPSYKLSPVRFTWSDVKLWTELDRLLQRDAGEASHHAAHACGAVGTVEPGATAWGDAWRLYEEVCIVCAGLWMGSWRGNSTASYSSTGGNWGGVQLEGDDDLSMGGSYMRSLGNGIEGRPMPGSMPTTSRAMRRTSGMSFGRSARAEGSSSSAGEVSISEPGGKNAEAVMRDRQVLTTLALLQTFHANTGFLFSRLASFLPEEGSDADGTVVLTPKDVLSFELGPLSGLDAKFLEWLADEYGGDVRLVVRRGWRDLFGLVFGFGSL